LSHRRQEPPNPTAKALLRARKQAHLMHAASSGLSDHQIADVCGYRTADAARGAVERLRGRIVPHPQTDATQFEMPLVESLKERLWATAELTGDVNAYDFYSDSAVLHLDLLDTTCTRHPPRLFPEGDDPGPIGAHRGEWTEGLELRSQNWSFKRIARKLGIADWFDALTMIHHDHDALLQKAAARLRATQMAELDPRIRQLAAPTATVPVDLAAAEAMLRLLRRRAHIRGVFLDPPGWWLEPCPAFVIRY